MLEDEFKELLHHIGLALGFVGNHPNPSAYAAALVTAHDSVVGDAKTPDPVIEPVAPLSPISGDPVLTDGTEWPALAAE